MNGLFGPPQAPRGLLSAGIDSGEWLQDPRKQALLSAGLGMLAASSGGRERPTLGNALISGLMSGQGAYQSVLASNLAMRREGRQERREDREDARMERQDAAEQQAAERERQVLGAISGGAGASTPEQYRALGQNLMSMGDTARAKVYFDLADRMQPQAAAQPAAVQEYEFAKQQGYQGSYLDFQRDKQMAGVSQRSPDPYFQAIPTPQGYMRFNARTGQMEPINVDGAVPQPIAADVGLKREMSYAGAEGAASGKIQGEAASTAGATLAKADQAMKAIDDTLNAPGLATATGASGMLDPRNYLWGTDAANARTRIDQLQGQAFLEAFESLKGGGQITEVEGKKATDAMARLSRAQSDEEFRNSLMELRQIIAAGRERAAARVNQPPAMLQQPQTNGASPGSSGWGMRRIP